MPAGVEAELLKEAFPKKLAVVSVDEPLRAKVGGALVAISVGKGFATVQVCRPLLSYVVTLSYHFLRLCCNIFCMEYRMLYVDVLGRQREWGRARRALSAGSCKQSELRAPAPRISTVVCGLAGGETCWEDA